MSYNGRRGEDEMRSRIEVGDNGSKGSLVVEVPRGTSTTTRPDPGAGACDVGQIRLEENFRSSEGVIETARGFVDKIKPRLQKSMKFAYAQPYEEGDVVALSFESPQEEADYIVNAIKSLRGVAFQDA